MSCWRCAVCNTIFLVIRSVLSPALIFNNRSFLKHLPDVPLRVATSSTRRQTPCTARDRLNALSTDISARSAPSSTRQRRTCAARTELTTPSVYFSSTSGKVSHRHGLGRCVGGLIHSWSPPRRTSSLLGCGCSYEIGLRRLTGGDDHLRAQFIESVEPGRSWTGMCSHACRVRGR
jgi:hypothetical protein